MTITTNNNFENLVEYLKRGETVADRDPYKTPEYKEFIAKFPASRIAGLNLNDYCVGKGSESFCWWIERGLEPVLGRYMPGTARGHILYFEKDGSIYKHARLKDLSDEDALRYTLRIQSTIASASPDDLQWIDDNRDTYTRSGVEPRVTIGSGRKLRLLACYLPNKVLTISSAAHIGHFLQQLGCHPRDIPPESQPIARMQKLWGYFEQAKDQVRGLTPFSFVDALYRSPLGLAPVKEQQGSDLDVLVDNAGMNDASDGYMPAKNQIFYGPPGTGKTYETINAALEILDPAFLAEYRSQPDGRTKIKARFDELASDQHVRFVTFHQSFSYEDFVEGLRASTTENGAVRYDIEDGIFKMVCDSASVRVTQREEAPIDLSGRRIWKMSLGNTQGWDAYIYDDCINTNQILLGYGGGQDFTGCSNRQDVASKHQLDPNSYEVTAVTTFITTIKVGDLVVVTDGNLKFRAIGEVVGDYNWIEREDNYRQSRSVKWLMVFDPSLQFEQLMNKQFSQMTLYELKPGSINTEKLAALLGNRSGSPRPFAANEEIGKYKVLRATADVLELEKPKGNALPIAMSLLNTLADYVRTGRITIEDISQRRVFERVPDSKLDPYLVNGYSNILPALVERLCGISNQTPSAVPTAKVLIIDEINRGNIARIFGELITLIEPSKRQGAEESLEVMLPYSKKRFSVPNNVYIIGTMNTADRSLTGLDIALRRRFVFREMPPDHSLLDGVLIEGVDIGNLLRILNQRIEVLLDRDHCLGHTFFLPLKDDPTLAQLASIFRGSIIPLLQEYFFEDWERIHWVLNDHRKPLANQFVTQTTASPEALFGNVTGLRHANGRWKLNHDAFSNVKSYSGIVGA